MPFFEVYQQGAAEDQAQMYPQSPKLSPQRPSPAILHLSTCYGEYLGFKVCIWPQDGSRPKHFGDFLSPGLMVFLLPTLYKSQPLPVINTWMTKRNTADRPMKVISSHVLLYWVLLLSSSLI